MNYVILFGSSGMLGKYVDSYFKKNDIQCYCINTSNFDIVNNIENVYEFMNYFLQEEYINYNLCVVNCSGIIPHNGKNDYVSTIRVNTIFPQKLFKWCDNNNIPMIHITTDCVFSGLNHFAYHECNVHDSQTLYGISKSLGEPLNCCIIRTSIIGHQTSNKNANKSLLQWVIDNDNNEEDKIIHGFIDHYWNGVTCLELSKIIHKIIHNKMYWKGIRNIYSKFYVSKFELLTQIANTYKLKLIVLPKITERLNRRLTSCYGTSDNFKIPSITTQLMEQKCYNLEI